MFVTKPDAPGKIFFAPELGGDEVADFNGKGRVPKIKPEAYAKRLVAAYKATAAIPYHILVELSPDLLNKAASRVAHEAGGLK